LTLLLIYQYNLRNYQSRLMSTMRVEQKVKRILLVDDDEAITRVLRSGLENRGYKVETYTDPLVALAGFQPGKYDVAVLDVRMQPMDGIELHQRLRSIDSGLATCFLTAYADAVEDRPPGAIFLQKPISLADLVAGLEVVSP
jgi:DNA-binding response OmpR family regulator